MIKQILPIVVAACVAPCFAAEGWITDMDAAKKQAAEQKKDLMIEFTGSDWCPPCMQLRANVFSKPDFQKEAQKNFLPMQAGDVLATFADVDDLKNDIGFSPKTSLEAGIARWAEWFRAYVGKGA